MVLNSANKSADAIVKENHEMSWGLWGKGHPQLSSVPLMSGYNLGKLWGDLTLDLETVVTPNPLLL